MTVTDAEGERLHFSDAQHSGDIPQVIEFASRYILDGEQPFPGTEYPLTHVELAEQFPARYAYLGELIDKHQNGALDEETQNTAIGWFSMMNNLASYVDAARTDPHSRVLYERQVPVMEDLQDFLEHQGHERAWGYISLPMATGKTILFTEFVKAAGARTLVVVPSKELIDQTEEKFKRFSGDQELDIGRVYSGQKRYDGHITITTYQSLIQQTKRQQDQEAPLDPKSYQLVILDEAHHALGEKTRKALDRFDHAPVIGLTASENYSARRRLEHVLPAQIHKAEIPEVVESGLIAPFMNLVMRCHADMSQVEITSSGEYEQKSLQQAVNTPERNNAIADVYEQAFRGFKAIGSCAGVSHAVDLAHTFRERGINAQVIHGNMTKRQRKAIMDGLNKPIEEGGIEIVFNDKVLTEGIDVPGVNLCLNAAPTLSYVRAKQRGGRSLRLNPDDPQKLAYILDVIDEDYERPPVLFADENVGGSAYAFPSWIDRETHGYHMPKLEVLTSRGEGYSFIFDPDEVAVLADSYDAQRSKPKHQNAPTDWYSHNSLLSSFNVPKSVVARALKELREIDPELFETESERHALKETGPAATGIHYSPMVREALEEFIDEPPVADVLARTADQVAAIYDWTPGVMESLMLKLSDDEEDEVQICVARQGQSRTRQYFSANVVTKVAEWYGVADYSQTPPPNWQSEVDLREKYGEEVFDNVFKAMVEKNSALLFTDIITYTSDIDGITACQYLSQEACKEFESQVTPPTGYINLGVLAERLEFSQEKTESIIAELIERRRLNSFNSMLGSRDGVSGLYVAEEMVTYIPGYLRYKADKVATAEKQERNLQQMLGELALPERSPTSSGNTTGSSRRHSSGGTGIRNRSSNSRQNRSGQRSGSSSKSKTSSELSEEELEVISKLSPTLQRLYFERKESEAVRKPRNRSSKRDTSESQTGSSRSPNTSSKPIKSTSQSRTTDADAAPRRQATRRSEVTTTQRPKLSAIDRARLRQKALAKFSR